MNFAKRLLLELQEISLLAARAARGLFRTPHYVPETIAQMDSVGVGSLTIIILTGFFTGGVLTLQTYQTLASYGAVDQIGYLVAISLVRELGPVLTALMVTGRVVSASRVWRCRSQRRWWMSSQTACGLWMWPRCWIPR